MKKTIFIVIAILLVLVLIIGGIYLLNNNKKEDIANKDNNLQAIKIESVEDMTNVIESINTKLGENLPKLMTQELDISNQDMLKMNTGLQSTNNVEKVVVSEPLMSAQAYSLVLVKVSDNADIEAMKKEMLDNVDIRKWICVSAEKVYVTNYNNVICLVMSNEEWAKSTYEEFKNIVGGKVGKELQRTEQM